MFVDIKTAQDHFLTPHWTRTHHAQLPIFCALRRARRRNRKRDYACDKQVQMCCITPPPLPHGSVQAAHTERHMGLLNAGPQAGPQGPCAAHVRHAHAQSQMRPLCRTLHAPARQHSHARQTARFSHPQLKGWRPLPSADLLQVQGVGELPTTCARSRPSLATPMNPLRSAPRTSRSATRCVQGMRFEISWIGMGRTPCCSNICGARCAARHLRREQAHTSVLRSMRIRSG